MKIVLISCVKMKKNISCKASDLYISPWFKNAYKYAIYQNADKIFILSAKYGLLKSDEIVNPYDETLNKKRVTERKNWAEEVLSKLKESCDLKKDEFIILASIKYREYLVQPIDRDRDNTIHRYTIPLEGLTQGKQLQFFKNYFEGNVL